MDVRYSRSRVVHIVKFSIASLTTRFGIEDIRTTSKLSSVDVFNANLLRRLKLRILGIIKNDKRGTLDEPKFLSQLAFSTGSTVNDVADDVQTGIAVAWKVHNQ